MNSDEILNIYLPENDAGALTVREYLVKLLLEVWQEGEGFSGKRPFGNSGWENELVTPLAENGIEDPYEAIIDAIQSFGRVKIRV